MKSAFFAFVFFLISLSAHAAPPKPGAPEDLKAKTVALIKADEEGGTHVYCSGVWIGKDKIVTAAHCVDDLYVGAFVEYAVESDVYNVGDYEPRAVVKGRKGEILILNTDKDLAVIHTVDEAPAHPVAVLAKALPAYGSTVQAVGHGKGMWWSYAAGNVSGFRIHDGIFMVQATVPISPGYSGGGLFDANGRLVGISSRGIIQYHINLFVSSNELAALVK